MKHCFLPGDMLLPKDGDLKSWAVIACDQFTSDPAYWQRVRRNAGDALSAVNMILPEAELPGSSEDTVNKINLEMQLALDHDMFTCYPDAFVYVERTQKDGSVRQGVVGVVDLEAYDFRPEIPAKIKATEQTVTERIPPRAAIRKNAPLEFSHTILFCDDPQMALIEPLAAETAGLQKLYDFDLMEGGGHICGWLLSGGALEKFKKALDAYMLERQNKAAFLVADGNHSLATAKRCYENLKATLPESEWKNHPARFAMVEVENIHSDAIVFHPIHRILTSIEPEKLLAAMKATQGEASYPITWVQGAQEGTAAVHAAPGLLSIAALQPFLDGYLLEHAGEMDYIHDDDALRSLAKGENCLGLMLESMNKSQLFAFIAAGNTCPRKTFSLGHAVEKRYYLEGRKIR